MTASGAPPKTLPSAFVPSRFEASCVMAPLRELGSAPEPGPHLLSFAFPNTWSNLLGLDIQWHLKRPDRIKNHSVSLIARHVGARKLLGLQYGTQLYSLAVALAFQMFWPRRFAANG
jgi:hypothetical protein